MKFSIKDIFSKCYQTRSFLQIWLHLLKKSFMENFIFLSSKNMLLSSWKRNALCYNYMRLVPDRLYSADIYLIRLNNGNTSTMFEICSKLRLKTLLRPQWRCSSVFIVNVKQILQIPFLFQVLLWTSKCRLGSWIICTVRKSCKSQNQPYWKMSGNR